MKNIGRWRVGLVVGFLAACGGGGGGGGVAPTTPSSTEVPVVLGQSGPGDVSHYFPFTVGNSWTYRGTGTGAWAGKWTDTASVKGTVVISGVTAYAIAQSNAGGGGPLGNMYYVNDANGLAILDSDDALERLITPRWQLRYPVQVGNQFVALDRHDLDSGVDIDGDGIHERVDVLSVVRVVAFEAVDVPAGHFSNAARVESEGTWVFHLSRTAEIMNERVVQTAWLVPNVGIARELMTLTVLGFTSTEEIVLESATVGGVTIGAPITPTPPTAQLTSLSLTPSSATVGVGTTLQLTATGGYSDGTFSDLSGQATWLSSDPTKVTVSGTGLITGVASGAATITATSGLVSAAAQVTVFQPTPSPVPPLSQSVAYQIDYAHSGRAVFADSISFPSSPAWSVTLNGQISYPLIADGKVFVTTSAGLTGSGDETTLYALDLRTGSAAWGPIAIPGMFYWSAHAYDNGKLFVVNRDGVLRAFNAATGSIFWSTSLPGQYSFSSPPTAVNGIVYVGGAGIGGTLYAVDEASGNVLWTASVANGDESSPAVSDDGVFVSYPCQVYDFDPLSGSLLWHYSGGCYGGGGSTPALAFGKLFVTNQTAPGMVFDADNGSLVGRFTSGPIPAFTTQAGLYLNAGTLTAIDVSSQNVLWTFAGDGRIAWAPIVINDVVVAGSTSGQVYALNSTTGNLIWSANAGAELSAPGTQGPVRGLGAGEGYLVVPAGNVLTAWRIVGP